MNKSYFDVGKVGPGQQWHKLAYMTFVTDVNPDCQIGSPVFFLPVSLIGDYMTWIDFIPSGYGFNSDTENHNQVDP